MHEGGKYVQLRSLKWGGLTRAFGCSLAALVSYQAVLLTL